MADSDKPSTFQQLKKDVTCPKCGGPFTHPKLLPCLHSVCTRCLAVRDGERVREGLKFLVSCPVCPEETELPKSGLASLPSAYFKHNMMKVYRMLEVVEGERQQGCDECQRARPDDVSIYCSTCGFICSSCADNHRSMRSFSDHSTTSLEKRGSNNGVHELQSQLLAMKPATKESALRCEKHGQPLEMYCKPCKRLVCVTCTQTHHKPPSHETSGIESLIEEQKGDMCQYLESVKDVRSAVRSTIERTKDTRERLHQQQKIIEDSVNTSFAELFRQLEILKAQIVESSKKTAEDKLAKLSEELSVAEKRVSELDTVVKTTEESLAYTTDQELLALKRYMTIRLKELASQKKVSATEASFLLPPLELPESCADRLEEVSKRHISVFHDLSYSKTKAMGDGVRRADVGKETAFTIQMLTESGAPCLEKQEVVVNIVMPRNNKDIPSTVSPGEELGTFLVSYTPADKGQYRVSVLISGVEISGSPYLVSAKPSKLESEKPCDVCVSLEWPWGVACGPNRQIYVTKLYQHVIAILDKEGHVVNTVGLKGQKPGYLWSPTGIAVDKEGYIFVADGQENGRVQKFNMSGQYISYYPNLCNPHGVMLNRQEDRLYVCDKDNGSVVVLDKNLQLLKVFGELDHTSDDGFESVSGHLQAPHSTAEDFEGNIYVTDMQDDGGCVHVFSKDGQHLRTIHHPTNSSFSPAGICIEDDLMYVCDSADNCLVVFHTNGELVTTRGSYGTYAGQFHSPLSVAVDLDGFLYVCDHCNARVQVF